MVGIFSSKARYSNHLSSYENKQSTLVAIHNNLQEIYIRFDKKIFVIETDPKSLMKMYEDRISSKTIQKCFRPVYKCKKARRSGPFE